jgi:transposase
MQNSSTKIPGTYKELKREYINQAEELAHHKERLVRLEHQLEYFKKQFFGRKSEKSPAPENQLTLDGILPEKSHETKTQEIKGYQRTIKKAKPGKKPLPKDLPRKRVYHKPGYDEIHCHCGKQMEPFFEDVHEELNFIPAKMEVIEHVYPKYSCTDCHDKVVQARTIDRPIEKGRPGPGLLAQVVVSKYEDHLPLDRQVKIFHRFKVDIAKSTMSHWIGCIYDLFTPIYDKMKERVLSSGYVLSDDTGIKVLDKNIKGKTHQGYIWSYGDLKQVVFHYTRTRSREGPKEFLNGYKGYLQTDGYSGYNESVNGNGITHIGCWSHARRKFYDIKDSEPEANELVKIIGKLFLVEKEAKEKQFSYEGIKLLREQKSVPILKELKIRLDKMKNRYLPKSPMAGAITYALNQWDKLNVYVTDGRLEISNNFSERCIKTVVIGRKNWLFAGSHEGAKRSAMMFSLTESCKLLEINTWEYLNDIFSRINEHPVKMEDLTPLGWKKSRENQDGVN